MLSRTLFDVFQSHHSPVDPKFFCKMWCSECEAIGADSEWREANTDTLLFNTAKYLKLSCLNQTENEQVQMDDEE